MCRACIPQLFMVLCSPSLVRPTAGMKWMQYIISITALLGILTALTVGLFSISRIIMAASRDWLLPSFLARISPRTQTPLIAQMVFGVIIGGWVGGDGVACVCFLYAGCCLAGREAFRRPAQAADLWKPPSSHCAPTPNPPQLPSPLRLQRCWPCLWK